MQLAGTINTRILSEIDSNLTEKIIRSDRLDYATLDDLDCLARNGFTTIIDLRSIKRRPSSIAEDGRFKIEACNFDADEWDKIKKKHGNIIAENVAEYLPQQYLNYIKQFEVIKKILLTIIEAFPHGVVIMCHHGKDRTGIVIALMLMIAGVSKETIINDYVLSTINLKQLRMNDTSDFFETNDTVMRIALDLFVKEFCSIENYLYKIGLNQTQIFQLKAIIRRNQ